MKNRLTCARLLPTRCKPPQSSCTPRPQSQRCRICPCDVRGPPRGPEAASTSLPACRVCLSSPWLAHCLLRLTASSTTAGAVMVNASKPHACLETEMPRQSPCCGRRSLGQCGGRHEALQQEAAAGVVGGVRDVHRDVRHGTPLGMHQAEHHCTYNIRIAAR